MAITLDQSPIGWIYGRNKVIIAASSGNYANDGFRYVFEVEVAGETTTFQLPPNPANSAIIDLSKHITQYLGPRMNGNDVTHASIHDLGAGTATLHVNELASTNATTTCQLVAVTVKEGWVIAGVFTPTTSGQATCSFVAHNAILVTAHQVFNNAVTIGTNAVMTNRNEYTGFREITVIDAINIGPCVPVMPNDKGVVSFITDNGTYTTWGFVGNYLIKGVLVQADGTLVQKQVTVAAAAGQITHFGCYPYNLSQSTIGAGFFDPSAYPNYKYYTISLHDGSEPAEPQIGLKFVFFEKQYQAKTLLNESSSSEPLYVRLAFVNDLGGWDYFNFNYLTQYTQKTERKRMRGISGSYTGTQFSANQYDRGLKELSVFAERTMSMQSKPLDRNEWLLMSVLIRSLEVQLLNSDIGGDFYQSDPIPVVIETNDNVEHRPLDSRLRSITLLAREAHPVV
jgi:hypothetical protein